ncbi:TonB-dependent receptor [Psychrosphaera sp. B3R10]|uniref:TonB-dependent receptor n=1 Tax=unclassified Psychrosphaera TaxID=2641570 RepID=UPI001C08FEA5|nr:MULTISPECIES: TonB-dependent receptor [unclassified Psychrosphaera]MBU2881148.1 TonB-dependent receptor [Psychrosphaera sp. I2R16]MBU2988253.1 TonB-dependent receptor [Psychrosphaera sp. B3R10]MDO6718462.1 TonB-dependent receptor [Psychrosphaera sp. 1_MG-2023]
MNNNRFVKTKLATSVSLILGALSTPLYAADETDADADVEVIQVTGIRGSLIKSQDLKRSSSGVVDAISAEDIGKFPDTNLAESMQRIAGVSIDRQNGEGSKVTVRGIPPEMNLVTLNGRQMPVTTGNRSFDFANIASESISGVIVTKTGDAAVPTGGIGSVIDIQTHKPLAHGGTKASFGVKAVADTSTEDGSVTPELSGLYSTVSEDGNFGVAISASYQERESGNAQALVGTGWRSFPGTADTDWSGSNAAWGGVAKDATQTNRPADSDVYSVPQTGIYKFEEQQRTRTNAQLVLQYRPIESVTATLDYTYMQNDIDVQHNDISAWYNFGTSENIWTDGPVASPLIYSEDYGDGAGNGLADLSMARGFSSNRNESKSLGLNVEWQVNSDLKLTFDAHSSEASRTPNGKYGSAANMSMAAFVRSRAATDFSGDRPILAVDGSEDVQWSDMRVTGSTFGNSQDASDLSQQQVNGSYILNENSSIDFGVSLTTVSNHSQAVNVQRNDWGGMGVDEPSIFTEDMFPVDSIQDRFNTSGGNFDGLSGNMQAIDRMFVWDFEAIRDIAAVAYPTSAGTIEGDCGNLFCPSTNYGADTDRETEEDSTAIYAKFNYEGEMGDMYYSLHVGARYEDTEVVSTSIVTARSGATWISANEVILGDGGRVYQTQTGGYDYFLPSINLNVDVTDDIIVRAAYSQTIGRPNYSDIQGGTVVGSLARTSGGNGSAGNPSLLPLESTNLDLSVEWYYSESSYLSFGLFKKDTQNYIANVVDNSDIYNIANPGDGAKYDAARAATGSVDANVIRDYIFANYADDPFVDVATGVITGDPATDNVMNMAITVPTNDDRKTPIDGMELSLQHMFDESGFGVIANYTAVNTDLSYDVMDLNDQPVLTNISDSANFIAFYDANGFQARIAYNWRDEFLSSRYQGDVGPSPVFVEAYSQIDFNMSYDVAQVEGLTVFFEGINITDNFTRSHGRSEKQVLNLTETGPRYNFGARYSF